MLAYQAITLGVVEGVTEFLPVSSTGHLLLTQRLFGLEATDVSHAYAIVIQGGAIAAVAGLYRKRLLEIARGFWERDRRRWQLGFYLLLAFLPAAILGLLFDHKIEKYLFGLWAVAVAWFVGGIGLLIFSRGKRQRLQASGHIELEQLTWQKSLAIGTAQALALWPGTSRSLVTIVAALLIGLTISAALEFSFLLGLLTLGAATAYKALKLGPAMFATYGALNLSVGFFTAWLFAALSIRWMVDYLEEHSMALFGYWRVGLAVVTAALLYHGSLAP